MYDTTASPSDVLVSPERGAAPLDPVQALVDTLSFLVWATDQNGVCTLLSANGGRAWEHPEQFTAEAWMANIHPQDGVRLQAEFAQIRATSSAYKVAYRVVRSDGSTRAVHANGSPIFAPDGTFTGYTGVIVDGPAPEQSGDFCSTGFRLLTQHSTDVLTQVDQDGVLVYVSPSITRVLGYEPQELIGFRFASYVHPDDVGLLAKRFAGDAEGSSQSRSEFRLRRRDGTYAWISSHTTSLRNTCDSGLASYVSVSRDISHERALKADLEQREARFRGLTTLASDWYWETDAEGRYTLISEGLALRTGIEASSLLGRTRQEVSGEPLQPGLVEYAQKFAARQVFKNLRYQTTGFGRVVEVSIWGEPVFSKGEFAGYRGVSRDLTEEVTQAAQLAKLAAENTTLADTSFDMFVLIDHTGRFVKVNKAVLAITGYTPEEVLGRRYADFVVPEDLPRIAQASVALQGNETTVVRDFDSSWVRKDGTVARISWALQYSHEKEFIFCLGRDVSERYKAKAELQQSHDRLRGIIESMEECFLALDDSDTVYYANAKAQAFFDARAMGPAGCGQLDAFVALVLARRRESLGVPPMGALAFEAYCDQTQTWLGVKSYAHDDGLSIFFLDITERRAAQDAMQKTTQRVHDILRLTPAGYVLANPEGLVQDVNPALCAMVGYERKALIGQPLNRLFETAPTRANSAGAAQSTLAGAECTLRHKDGYVLHALSNASIERDADGDEQGLTLFLTNITQRKKAEFQLQEMANHDILTGLPNRAFLGTYVANLFKQDENGPPSAVMFLDLDRFKEVNDSLGHRAGDVLLQEIARRLKAKLRPYDLVARLGGDEFVIVAHCPHSTSSAESIAQKLLKLLSAPVNIDGQDVFVSGSIGISMFPQDGITQDALFQSADTAMYEAKAAGRNAFRFFKPEMAAAAGQRMVLEAALRRALERDEFELHYQPRVHLGSNRVASMEALIRWNHPTMGLVTPGEFIPLAEERGYIEAIGQWVLRRACEQTKQLSEDLGFELQVSVNLSARQLKTAAIVEQVAAALAVTGLNPRQLELEITESAIIEDVSASVVILKSLKALGVSLSLDDFGTGYCGIGYLRRFPIDTLKLDKSFLDQDDSTSETTSRFVKAFVDLAHTLDLEVVAEGVETAETLQMVTEAGCDQVQGYHFARPMPLSALTAFFLQRTQQLQSQPAKPEHERHLTA